MKENKIIEMLGTIIDVRTPEEFQTGNVEHSINIPLHEIQQRIDEIKTMKQPIIVCCVSGARSGQAAIFLSQQGVECYNGGSWRDVSYSLLKEQ